VGLLIKKHLTSTVVRAIVLLYNTNAYGGHDMQKQYTLEDFTNLEYYNKLRCADGDVVQYIAKRKRARTHCLITVKNNTVLKVQKY